MFLTTQAQDPEQRYHWQLIRTEIGENMLKMARDSNCRLYIAAADLFVDSENDGALVKADRLSGITKEDTLSKVVEIEN